MFEESNPLALADLFPIGVGLAALGLLAGTITLLQPRLLRLRAVSLACTALLLAMFICTVNAVIAVVRPECGVSLAVGVALVASIVAWRLVPCALGRPALRVPLLTGALLLGGVGLASWFLWQFDDRGSLPAGPNQFYHPSLMTDLGTPIQVVECMDLNPWVTYAEGRIEGEFANSIIKVAPSDPSYSCHGWTFTNGQCHVVGDAVFAILQENGYVEVCPPDPGDLVIYTSDVGRIMHSGIVRGVDPDGLTLVESKWDLLGRYLHPVEMQPYSQQFKFFRSNRLGHLLLGAKPRSCDTASTGPGSPSGSH